MQSTALRQFNQFTSVLTENDFIQERRINNICKLNGNMKALTVMERPEDTIIYAAGDAAIVYAFSVENHDIVDVWGHSENITAMDCVLFEDGGTVFAFGSVSGKIHLRCYF